MNRCRTRIVCAVLALLSVGESGCRAIRRIGESRQSIAARRLSGQGFQAMHDGQWEVAESLFTDALDVSKSDDRAHWGLAEAYWNRGQRGLAIEQMEQAVRLSADDPAFVVRLGRMYVEVDRFQDGDALSQQVLISDRDSPTAWALRGDCLKAAEKYDEALAAYHRALALQPDYPEVQLQAAEIYQIQRRYDRLLATLDRLQDGTGVADAPARVDILQGIAMRSLGRIEEAGMCFTRAIKKNPDNAAAHLELASLALERGDSDAARRSLQVALELNGSAIQPDRTMEQVQAARQRLASESQASPPPTTFR